MDPVAAKTLVSATLVVAIALFSLAAFQALFAQVLADLRAVQPRPVPADSHPLARDRA